MNKAELIDEILGMIAAPYTPVTDPYQRLKNGLSKMSLDNLGMLRLGILVRGNNTPPQHTEHTT